MDFLSENFFFFAFQFRCRFLRLGWGLVFLVRSSGVKRHQKTKQILDFLLKFLKFVSFSCLLLTTGVLCTFETTLSHIIPCQDSTFLLQLKPKFTKDNTASKKLGRKSSTLKVICYQLSLSRMLYNPPLTSGFGLKECPHSFSQKKLQTKAQLQHKREKLLSVQQQIKMKKSSNEHKMKIMAEIACKNHTTKQ